MSRHRRLRNYKPGQTVVEERRNPESERIAARTPPSDVVKQLIARIPTATREEAINIGLILSQLGHGDASLLSNANDPAVAETISRMRERAAKEDAANAKFNANSAGFINEVLENAERIKPKGEALDRAIARGAEIYQQALKQAAAEQASNQLSIAWRMANDPEEVIEFLPVYDNIKQQGGGSVPVEIPTDINIGTFKLRYMSGHHKVRKIVADRYREILQGRQETSARMSAISYDSNHPTTEYNEAERKMQQIDKQFNSSHQGVPIV